MNLTRLDGITALNIDNGVAWPIGEYNREFPVHGANTGNYATMTVNVVEA